MTPPRLSLRKFRSGATPAPALPTPVASRAAPTPADLKQEGNSSRGVATIAALIDAPEVAEDWYAEAQRLRRERVRSTELLRRPPSAPYIIEGSRTQTIESMYRMAAVFNATDFTMDQITNFSRMLSPPTGAEADPTTGTPEDPHVDENNDSQN